MKVLAKKPEQNLLNHLITVLHLLYNKCFSIASTASCPKTKSKSISSKIKLHCIFIYAAFKPHTGWSNTQHVSTPTTTILPTTMGTSHSLNCFDHIIYKLVHTKIWAIGLMSRVFTNGQGVRNSILGQVIPKTQKMVLDATLLKTQHYKVSIKGKVEQSREGVVPSPTPWCSSNWKGSLQVTLN